MKLVLEIINIPKYDIFQKNVQFDTRGGKIGRSKSAKWTLNDPSRIISNFHADISYKNGQYYITDISTNGVFIKTPYKKLVKNMPIPLNEKMVIMIGDYDIAVKILDGAFTNTDEGQPVQEKSHEQSIIPDEFFIGNPDEKAFGIIQESRAEESDIVSILKSDTNFSSKPVLSDIDSIIGFDEIDHNDEIENPMSLHIDPPTFEEDDNVNETKRDHSSDQGTILKILGLKMGIDVEKMTKAEQEMFAMNIAEIAFLSLEQLKDASQALDKIRRQMGVPTHTSVSNPIVNADRIEDLNTTLYTSGHVLVPHIKQIFRDINTHNIASYTTLKKVTGRVADMFSPEKLYYEFDKNMELNKNFTNKKALAWEAYSKKFKFLDTFEEMDESDIFEIKKEYKSILDTINIGYSS